MPSERAGDENEGGGHKGAESSHTPLQVDTCFLALADWECRPSMARCSDFSSEVGYPEFECMVSS